MPLLTRVLIHTAGLAFGATLFALMLDTVASLGGVWAVRAAGKLRREGR